MKRILWRIRFTLAVRKIFSKPKGAFPGNHLLFGWKVSGKTKHTNLKPYEAALEEIGEWYE